MNLCACFVTADLSLYDNKFTQGFQQKHRIVSFLKYIQTIRGSTLCSLLEWYKFVYTCLFKVRYLHLCYREITVVRMLSEALLKYTTRGRHLFIFQTKSAHSLVNSDRDYNMFM